MALYWNDFNNNETGLSVRTKINTFNQEVRDKVNIIDTDVSELKTTIRKTGFADYNDSATHTTPISVPATNTYVDITNDGLGVYTNTSFLPSGVTSLWNTSTNRFDFTELSLGDMIDLRLDVSVTTTTPSQVVVVVLELGTSTYPYEILYTNNTFKDVSTYNLNRYNGFYIGNNDTLNGGGRFRIKSDASCTVTVNGWYIRVISK